MKQYILILVIVLWGCGTPTSVRLEAEELAIGEWVVLATTPARDGGLFGGHDSSTAILRNGSIQRRIVTCHGSEALVAGDRVSFTVMERPDVIALAPCAILTPKILK